MPNPISPLRRGVFLLGWLLALFMPLAATAQITVNAAVSNNRVRVGETVTLTIEVEGTRTAEPPAIAGVDGLAVRYVGPAQQVTIVNGQMTARVQHRYALTAQREGQFRLGPFEVTAEGETHRTGEIVIAVAPASAIAQPLPDQPAADDVPDLRLVLTVEREQVYLHERVPVDVTLYVGPVSARDLQYPTLPTEGVSVEEFTQPVRTTQVIDGKNYEVLRFRTAVTPVKTGMRSLGPAKVALNLVQRPRNFFFTQRQPVELTSNGATLEVLPLPTAGRPADFTGAVGNFTLDVTASPTEVRAGDPITVRISLRGDGHLGKLQPPAYAAGSGFKVYDPQLAQGEGDLTRVYEQVVIPEHADIDALPPLSFSFFQPTSGLYLTVLSRPIALVVQESERDASRQIVSAEGTEKRSDPEALGRDIVYIKDAPGTLVRRGEGLSHWWLLLFWQPVPVLLCAAVVLYDRRRRRLSGDERYARATRAGRTAKRALAKAGAALESGDERAFFDALEAAVREYLSAKLGLPPGAIDTERLARA